MLGTSRFFLGGRAGHSGGENGLRGPCDEPKGVVVPVAPSPTPGPCPSRCCAGLRPSRQRRAPMSLASSSLGDLLSESGQVESASAPGEVSSAVRAVHQHLAFIS